jgi:8-oxo-dGTP pyrophosphatase MutT (NUDIX family)
VAESIADLPESAPVLESRLVYEGRVWNVRSDRFRYGDHELERDWVDHPGAVAILAIDEQERVLVIRQYRHALKLRDWELPAGLLDVEGEEPLAAAKRELAEEADLKAEEWTKLVTMAVSPGGMSERVTIFEARGLSEVPAFLRTGEEADIELRWVELEELVGAAFDGRIQNGILITAALAAHARRH